MEVYPLDNPLLMGDPFLEKVACPLYLRFEFRFFLVYGNYLYWKITV